MGALLGAGWRSLPSHGSTSWSRRLTKRTAPSENLWLSALAWVRWRPRREVAYSGRGRCATSSADLLASGRLSGRHFLMRSMSQRVMNKRLYALKIELAGITPTIWRRFVVPADITLDRLHDVIQIVMGWLDYHLHEFIICDSRYTEYPESQEDGLQEGLFSLNGLVRKKNLTLGYLYDFGDSWRHTVTIEKINYQSKPQAARVVCLEGERACPPEDVGGVQGYYEFCEAIKDSSHEEHEEYEEWYSSFAWYDKIFDSEKFNLEKVNFELLTYVRWARTRVMPWQAE